MSLPHIQTVDSVILLVNNIVIGLPLKYQSLWKLNEMIPKTRIKIAPNLFDEKRYYPQRKVFGFWVDIDLWNDGNGYRSLSLAEEKIDQYIRMKSIKTEYKKYP